MARGKYTVCPENVDNKWRSIHESRGASGEETPPFFRDKRLGLGPQFRFNLLCWRLCPELQSKTSRDDGKSRYDKLVQALGLEESLIREAVSFSPKKNSPKWNEFFSGKYRNVNWLDNAVAQIDMLLREEQKGTYLPIKRYGEKRFDGQDAARKFQELLEHGERKDCNRDLLDEANPRQFFQSTERNALVESILKTLRGTNSGRPIINIYSNDGWSGLTPFASHLFDAIYEAQLPARLFYVPAGSHIPPERRRELVNLTTPLTAFLEDRDPVLEPPAEDARGVAEQINAIRRRLLQTPAIVIFAGVTAIQSALPHLLTVIRNLPETELLTLLSQPLIEPENEADIDVSQFYRNWFIVLSDKPMTTSTAYQFEAPRALPEPPSAQFGHIAKQLGVNDEELIKRWLHEDHSHALPRELNLVLAQFLLDKVYAPGSAEYTSAIVSALANQTDILTKRLVDWLHQNPFALLAVRFLALAPAGIRLKTLTRCIALYEAIKGESAPSLTRTGNAEDENFQLRVRNALECVAPFLIEKDDERFPPMDDVPHPTEFPEHPKIVPGARIHEAEEERIRTLDYRYSRLRQAIVSELQLNAESQSEFFLMQRILAEEALRQATIVMRHGSPDETHVFRNKRRLLQALFHGFLSLDFTSTNCAQGLCLGAMGTMPDDPAERYAWLCAFLLRNVLEDAPRWMLSRFYSENALKLDLLLLANNPTHYQAGGGMAPIKNAKSDCLALPPTPSGKNSRSKFGPTQWWELLVDQLIALTRCAHLTNSLQILTKASAFAAQIADEPTNIEQARNNPRWRRASVRLRSALDRVELAQLVEQHKDGAITTCVREKFRKWNICEGALFESRDGVPALPDLWRGASVAHLDNLDDQIDHLVEEHVSLLTTCDPAPHVDLDRFADRCRGDKVASRSGGGHMSTFSAGGARLAPYTDLQTDLGKSFVRDLILRLAEGLMIHADLSDQTGLEKLILTLRAIVAFQIAETLRTHTYYEDPLGSDYAVTGHSAHGFIRTALKSARQLGAHAAEWGIPPDKVWRYQQYLMNHARRTADRYAHHLARYRGESPMLLLIESSMARFESTQTPDRAAALLDSASKFLAAADKRLTTIKLRPRLRLYFLLERAKVYGQKAEGIIERLQKPTKAQALDSAEQAKQADLAVRCLFIAAHDARRFGDLAEAYSQEWIVGQDLYWRRLRTEQLKGISRQLGEILSLVDKRRLRHPKPENVWKRYLSIVGELETHGAQQ